MLIELPTKEAVKRFAIEKAPWLWRRRRPDARERWLREHTMYFGGVTLPREYEEGNLLLVGDIGSGKTTDMNMWVAHQFQATPREVERWNAFVLDPKNDFLAVMHNLDLPEGARIIDANPISRYSRVWAPWRDIRDPLAAAQCARSLARADGNSQSPFYERAPQEILAGVMHESVRLGIPFTLRQALLIALNTALARQYFRRSTDPIVRDKEKFLDESQGSTAANVESSITTKVSDLCLFAAMLEHAAGTYSLDELRDGADITVFGGDFRFNDLLKAWYGPQIQLLQERLLDQPNSRARKHYVIADEAHEFITKETAKAWLRFAVLGRSLGVVLVLAVQSPSQFAAELGELAAAVLMGACQNKLIHVVSDKQGAQVCSDLIGHKRGYEYLRSMGHNFTFGEKPTSGFNVGRSEHYYERPFVPPDDILRLRPADYEEVGTEGIAIVPRLARRDTSMRVWPYRVPPEELKRRVVQRHPEVPKYQDMKRPPDQMYLKPLSDYELRPFGLQLGPDDHRP